MENREKKLNLKGGTSILRYYRLQKTNKTEKIKRKVKNRKTGEIEEQVYEKVVEDRIYFTEEQVKTFSLDNNGMPKVPYENKNFTQFSNYFFDFWGHFLGAEGTILYGHLFRFHFRDDEKDYCWPDMKLIANKMGKSETTVRNHLETLEQYGFVYRFLVENVDKKKQDSTLYKLRTTIPFLPKELIDKLPEKLLKEHNKYLTKIGEDADRIIDFYDAQEFYDNLIQHGKVKENDKQLTFEDLEEIREYKKSKLLKQIKEEDNQLLDDMLNVLSRQFSKPSLDMWFSKLVLKRNGNAVNVYTPYDWIFNTIKGKYYLEIELALKEIDKNIEQVDIVLM